MSFSLNTKVNLNEDAELTATTYKIEIRGVILPVVKYDNWYIPLNVAKALTGYDHKQPCKLFIGLDHVRANVFINNGDLDDSVFNFNIFFIRFNDAIEIIRSKKKASVCKIKRIISDDMVGKLVEYAKTLPTAKLSIPDDIKLLPKVSATTIALPIRKRKSRCGKTTITKDESFDEFSDFTDSDEISEVFESPDIVEPPRKKQKVSQYKVDAKHTFIKIDQQKLIEEFLEFQEFKRLREMRQ